MLNSFLTISKKCNWTLQVLDIPNRAFQIAMSEHCPKSRSNFNLVFENVLNKDFLNNIQVHFYIHLTAAMKKLCFADFFRFCKYEVCRSKGCKVAVRQSVKMIQTWLQLNSGRLVRMGPGLSGRLLLETSKFER